MNQCKYWPSWQPQCRAECEGDFCEKHAAIYCCVCRDKATHECDHTGQLVCGAPLCNNCEGHTDTSKPAGRWGFMNHTHGPRRKSNESRSN